MNSTYFSRFDPPASPQATDLFSAGRDRIVHVWRDVVQPKEHGSWSLVLEPLALGLLVVPSVAGACIAMATIAGFFARRPLKIALRDRSFTRRTEAMAALLVCVVSALAGLGLAFHFATSVSWLPALVPAVVLGVAFLFFDLRNNAREELAEIFGAAAFAVIPAGIAAAGGAAHALSYALAFAALARSVPSVLLVRARVRGAKTRELRLAIPLLAATSVALIALGFGYSGHLPLVVGAGLVLLFARAVIYASIPHDGLRARTLGITEMLLGLLYVALVGSAWRL